MWPPQTKIQAAPLQVVPLSEYTEAYKALERKLDALSSKTDVLTGLVLAMSRTAPPLVTEADAPPAKEQVTSIVIPQEEASDEEQIAPSRFSDAGLRAPEPKMRGSVGRFAIQDRLLNRLRSKKTGDFVFIPDIVVTSQKALVSRAWRLFGGGGLVTVVKVPDGYNVIKRAPLPRGPVS